MAEHASKLTVDAAHFRVMFARTNLEIFAAGINAILSDGTGAYATLGPDLRNHSVDKHELAADSTAVETTTSRTNARITLQGY